MEQREKKNVNHIENHLLRAFTVMCQASLDPETYAKYLDVYETLCRNRGLWEEIQFDDE